MEEIVKEVLEGALKGDALSIAYLVVSVLVVIMAIVALVMKILIAVRYWKANKMPISSRMTGAEAARFVLDKDGLTHIKVKKAGFIRGALFGNFYNVYTKTIYLRSILFKIDDKKSVTATALAVQKAGLAKLCEQGDKATLLRNRLAVIGVFGPFLFIPVILLSVVIDLFLMKTGGVFTIIGMALGGLLLISGFIVTMLNIPVEKKANELALEMIREYGLANESEMAVMKKVFDTYIISYICDFILEVLRVVQWVLEILIKARGSSKS